MCRSGIQTLSTQTWPRQKTTLGMRLRSDKCHFYARRPPYGYTDGPLAHSGSCAVEPNGRSTYATANSHAARSNGGVGLGLTVRQLFGSPVRQTMPTTTHWDQREPACNGQQMALQFQDMPEPKLFSTVRIALSRRAEWILLARHGLKRPTTPKRRGQAELGMLAISRLPATDPWILVQHSWRLWHTRRSHLSLAALSVNHRDKVAMPMAE
ncbi:hypothetical protein TOPH_01327 [Tolypocladium ophioglossoides CBS 100239]|uniref:Uncharacterized protein n=1 Tax=Tolypocladium ophioglossoides (strain CBS 100239) TaxID=1163406 RepID=A0A0L0NK96_TOLOC|nr:hypothetical protein TOPH_01327 [Tolypocladium ophioglossoides CBS 100239]